MFDVLWIEVFGVFAISVMVVSYALEARHPRWVLVFAIGCMLAALYALLLGSLPFVAAEGIWAGIAFRRWRRAGAGRLCS